MRTTFFKSLLASLLSAGMLVSAVAGCAPVPKQKEATLPQQAAAPSPAARPETPLLAELDRYNAETAVDFSVALYEHDTGQAWTYNPSGRYLEASLVKVPILLTLLRQATEEGRELSAVERALAEEMIRRSDNAATDQLYTLIGGAPELQATYDRLGISNTPATEIWGANETTAEDQLRIATAVARGVDWIDPRLHEYAVVLLESVVPEQAWGISSGILRSVAEVGLKNGWLQDDLLSWNVGSSGFILGDGAEYSLVVLTAGTQTLGARSGGHEGAAAIVNRWELGDSA
ncbi:serine hydrolase [Arthrobacter sp. 7Tela_A1]|uniref:serine hydrolase n=1 Tax=Arthrobacter sp. 7Tela_A1 TaxID=3093745 RepID=UPI003BB7F6D6